MLFRHPLVRALRSIGIRRTSRRPITSCAAAASTRAVRCGSNLPWRRTARARQSRSCGRTRSIPRVFRASKLSVKDTVLKFNGARISLAAYTVHTLGEPLPPVSKRLGFSMLAQEEPRLAAWSVFSPATESVLMRSPPHGFGPKASDIRVPGFGIKNLLRRLDLPVCGHRQRIICGLGVLIGE
ncbi:unnamed protein product [Symbiodinium natans]|uniref:Uncharacterized protein n=1 Tax=Symbiodinium natans TaxID=878477 RepID=A0A812H904_9DINO|nr:unnamed protein product [Symbiodinium natans]